eukprot:Platyproteum_vivax@DN4271_c0_g1_i1.p1
MTAVGGRVVSLAVLSKKSPKKTGNFKTFDVFVRMLTSSLLQESGSVSVDLLTSKDLELLRSRAAGVSNGHQATNTNTSSSEKRYLILTYQAEFDRVHYPLALAPQDNADPAALLRTIHRLKNEIAELRDRHHGSDLQEENEELKKDLAVAKEALINQKRADNPEIRSLKREIKKLEEELAHQKDTHKTALSGWRQEKQRLQHDLRHASTVEERLHKEVKVLESETSRLKNRLQVRANSTIGLQRRSSSVNSPLMSQRSRQESPSLKPYNRQNSSSVKPYERQSSPSIRPYNRSPSIRVQERSPQRLGTPTRSMNRRDTNPQERRPSLRNRDPSPKDYPHRHSSPNSYIPNRRGSSTFSPKRSSTFNSPKRSSTFNSPKRQPSYNNGGRRSPIATVPSHRVPDRPSPSRRASPTGGMGAYQRSTSNLNSSPLRSQNSRGPSPRNQYESSPSRRTSPRPSWDNCTVMSSGPRMPFNRSASGLLPTDPQRKHAQHSGSGLRTVVEVDRAPESTRHRRKTSQVDSGVPQLAHGGGNETRRSERRSSMSRSGSGLRNSSNNNEVSSIDARLNALQDFLKRTKVPSGDRVTVT